LFEIHKEHINTLCGQKVVAHKVITLLKGLVALFVSQTVYPCKPE